MKTAISIPDPIFQAAENMAQRLGMPRSELFTVAMSEYMKAHKYRDVTESLNEVYSKTEEPLDDELVLMQMKSLPEEEW
ncbi:MAG: hypothetical protein V3U88_03190 [Methylococcales bacterium]